MFNTFLDYEKEHVHIHYISENFEENSPFFVILQDSFTKLKFYSLDMHSAGIWVWPNRSWDLLNGISILIYNSNKTELLFEQTHDFSINKKRTIYVQDEPITYSSNKFDIGSWWNYHEIVNLDSYGFKENLIKNNDIVVDIGANIGHFSLVAQQYNPKKIFAIEPSPETFKHLKNNTKKCSKIICINKGISDKTDTILFNHISTGSGLSSFFENDFENYGGVTTNDVSKIKVDVISFKDFIFQYDIKKIDCLKIDCEGAEWDIVRDNIDFINNNVRTLVMELHPWGTTKKISSSEEFMNYCNENLLNKLTNFKITIEKFDENNLNVFNIKATNMKEDKNTIELDISDDVFIKLAKQAHENNLTLNTYIINVLRDILKTSDYKFENAKKPQLLTEKQT